MLHVATLEVTSVAKETAKQMIKIITDEGMNSKTANFFPSQSDKPDTLVALANANPPPKSMTIDQGIFL